MFNFNLFSNPLTGNLSSPAATPADDALAQNVAERGAVLLQNSGDILPLNTDDDALDRRDRGRWHDHAADLGHRQLGSLRPPRS